MEYQRVQCWHLSCFRYTYVNDMQEGLKSYINLFADDAKLLKVVRDSEWMELQKDLDKMYEWSGKWKLEFNAQKCHVLEMGKSKRRLS